MHTDVDARHSHCSDLNPRHNALHMHTHYGAHHSHHTHLHALAMPLHTEHEIQQQELTTGEEQLGRDQKALQDEKDKLAKDQTDVKVGE